jgi:hypothetical protein
MRLEILDKSRTLISIERNEKYINETLETIVIKTFVAYFKVTVSAWKVQENHVNHFPSPSTFLPSQGSEPCLS